MEEDKVVHFTQINSSGPLAMWCACAVDSACTTELGVRVQPSSPTVPASSAPTCWDCERMGSRKPRSGGGGVMVSCLNCFIAGGSLYRFEYNVSNFSYWFKIRGGTCTTQESSPAHIVIERALSLLEKGFGEYHVFNNNCEDFAVFCKTGNKAGKGSSQATSVMGTAAASVFSKS